MAKSRKAARKRQRKLAKIEATRQPIGHVEPSRVFHPTVTRTPETYIEPVLHDAETEVTFSRFMRVQSWDEDGNMVSVIVTTGEREAMNVLPYRPSEDEEPEAEFAGAALPAEWTPELVKGWLGVAFDVLRRMPAGPLGPEGSKSNHPDIVRDVSESYGWTDAVAREAVTPAEIAMMDFALEWLLMLDSRMARVALSGVAQGFPLRLVGRVAGCSHEHARKLAETSAQSIAATLNSASKAA